MIFLFRHCLNNGGEKFLTLRLANTLREKIKVENMKVIDKKAIKEFKEIYEKEFGVEVDDAKALDLAVRLLNIYRVIYRPLPTIKKQT